jgi:ankyrin repeat protein
MAFVGVVVLVSTLAAQAPVPGAGEQFYAAIRTGELSQVRAVIDGGADVNAKERRGGATPLMNAAAFGTIDMVRLLLEQGADPNGKSIAGATALMWAVTDLAKVQLLLARGADVNAVSQNTGRSALILAAMSDRSSEIVKLLIANGADPKVVDGGGMTTLYAATVGNDIATIRLFVDAGVPVDAPDKFAGFTPLMNAVSNNNLEAVQLLVSKGANVNAASAPPSFPVKNGIIALGRLTPLLSAATSPTPIVQALIDAGADVNARDARGMTTLMLALNADHSEEAALRLLIAKSDLKIRSAAGETALDWAAKNGSTWAVKVLETAGAPRSRPVAVRIPAAAPVAHRDAVQRGVALLERSSGTFFVNSACGACHAQNVTDLATTAARKRGLPINEAMATQRTTGGAAAFGSTALRLLEREDGPAIDIMLYELAGLAAAAYPADRATDALVFNVSAQQWRDGHWHLGGQARPPIADGDVTRTALAVRGLRAYGLPGRRVEMNDRVRRAAEWLRAQKPITTDDRTFRLLGYAWAGEPRATLEAESRELIALQRSDGGWGQRPEMGSDAYATGAAMYALAESGVTNAAAALQRGAAYLLSTQRADGSWFVRSRAPKFQPYFDGGFPYEHEQWISSMATGWATAALAATLPVERVAAAR